MGGKKASSQEGWGDRKGEGEALVMEKDSRGDAGREERQGLATRGGAGEVVGVSQVSSWWSGAWGNPSLDGGWRKGAGLAGEVWGQFGLLELRSLRTSGGESSKVWVEEGRQ